MSSQSMLWRETADIFSHWIESVAATAYALLDRFRSQRQVQVIEESDDTFTFHLAGGAKQASIPDHRARLKEGALVGPLPAQWRTAMRDARAEVILQPARFLFRPLTLPKRAAEFLVWLASP